MKQVSEMSFEELEVARLDRARPFEEWVWDPELLVYRALPPLSQRHGKSTFHATRR